MSRKIAREISFKLIFESAFQGDEAMNELLEKLVGIPENEYELNEEDNKYVEEITNGVKEKQDELDDVISKYLKGWTMDRISKIDIAILRLAVYEILYRDDIPYKVSINEAIELAKVFGENSSASFINGILGEVVNNK